MGRGNGRGLGWKENALSGQMRQWGMSGLLCITPEQVGSPEGCAGHRQKGWHWSLCVNVQVCGGEYPYF